MAMKQEPKFPTFECVISNSIEDYDSEVEYFFLHKNFLLAQLAKLRSQDGEWSENYQKMMKYLGDLSDALVEFKDAPSHQFLVDLSMGEEVEDDTTERLLKSGKSVVADLTTASYKAREVMYWYVRNGKDPKFAKSFNPDRFQGLPFLRLALVYRSIHLANKE